MCWPWSRTRPTLHLVLRNAALDHALGDDLIGLVDVLARSWVELRLRGALLALPFRLRGRSRRHELLPLAHP